MTREQLEAERTRIEGRLAILAEEAITIEGQLARAKVSGKRVDTQWFVDARMALRFKNAEREKIRMELGRVRERIRRLNALEYSERFIATAAKTLPRELYDEIRAKVHVAA
jgi:hypothetical protein